MILSPIARVAAALLLIVMALSRGVAEEPTKPVVLVAQPDDRLALKLTADDAVRIGLAHNPQVAAGTAGVAAAVATYRSLAAFPSVQLGVTHAQGTSSAPTLNGQTNDTFIDVGETLDVSGQRRYQAASAGAQASATRYQLDETKLTLEQQIRDAYWSLVAARGQTAIAEEVLGDVERVHKLTQSQEQAGAAPHVDVVHSGIDVANALQAVISAHAAEQTAHAALNLLLARSPLAPVELADTLRETSAPPAVSQDLPELPDLQRLAIANRATLRAADEQVRAARFTLEQARASRFPDVTVDYERSVQQSSGSDAVLLGAHLPLLDLGEVSQTIRSAAASKKQAEAQAEQTRQQVAQQVAQAYVDFHQAQKLLVSYRDDILKPSVALLDMAQLGYKQGATGILPVIDAENTLRNARTGYIGALLALYKAEDELLAATGGLTERPSPEKGRKP